MAKKIKKTLRKTSRRRRIRNPSASQELVSSQTRRGTLRNIIIEEGPVKTMVKLRKLAEKNPELAADIWEDAKWVVRNPSARRNPRGLLSGDPVINEMLDSDEPVYSFPRRRNPSSPRRSVRSRLRRNPDFDWGPKVFDPFKDKHPFGKRPTTVRINPATPLRRRNRKRRSRNRRNPTKMRWGNGPSRTWEEHVEAQTQEALSEHPTGPAEQCIFHGEGCTPDSHSRWSGSSSPPRITYGDLDHKRNPDSDTSGGLFTSIYARNPTRRFARKRRRKVNPADSDTAGGLFTSIYARNRRKHRGRKIRGNR